MKIRITKKGLPKAQIWNSIIGKPTVGQDGLVWGSNPRVVTKQESDAEFGSCGPGLVFSEIQQKCVSQQDADMEKQAVQGFGNFMKRKQQGLPTNPFKTTGNEGTASNPMGVTQPAATQTAQPKKQKLNAFDHMNNFMGVMNPLAFSANVLEQNAQNKELERAYRESLVSQGPVQYTENRGDYEINTGMVDPYNTGAKSKGQFTNPIYLPMAQDGLSLGPISFSDEPVRRNVYEYDPNFVPMVAAAPAAKPSKSEPVNNNNAESNINFSLSEDFKEYARKANAYLKKVNPNTDVTGEMLAAGAQRAMEQYGRTVPVELALAQLQLEGYLEKGSKPNKAQRTKNPFNVGNTDDGSVVNHSQLQSGVNTYYDLMARSYLKKRTPNQLLDNFVNAAGNRYATAPHYEAGLKKIINNIQKTSFEDGGMYENSNNMRIRITKEPMENMAYGGQKGYGFDTGSRRVYSDMPESKMESISNTVGPVPREMATIEAEKGETILNDEGHFVIGGESHANGGTPLAAEEGDFIFSKKLKMKDPQQMAYFNKSFKKGGYGYADVAKQYNMNKYKGILQDPNADPIQKRTAELMLSNFENKLGMLAMAQESSKGFPQGIPGIAQRTLGEAAYGGYIPEMGYGGYLEEYQTKGEVKDPRRLKSKQELDELIKKGYTREGNTNVWSIKGSSSKDVKPIIKGTPGDPGSQGYSIKKRTPVVTEAWRRATPEQRRRMSEEAQRKWEQDPGNRIPDPNAKPATQGIPDKCPDGYTPDPTNPSQCIKVTELPGDRVMFEETTGTTGGGGDGGGGSTIPNVPTFDGSYGNVPYGWTQPDKNNALLAFMNRAGIRKYGSVRTDVNPVLGDFRNMDWRGRAAELQGTYNSQMNQLGTYQSPTSLAANASFMAGQQTENLINRAIDPIEQSNVQGYNAVGDRNMMVMNQALAGAAQNRFLRSQDRAILNQNFDNAVREADKGIVQAINQGDVNAAGIYNTNLVESDTHYYDPRSLRMKFNSPQARAKYIAAMRGAGPSDGDIASQYMATRNKLTGLSEEEKKQVMEYIFGSKGRASTTTYPFNPTMNRSTVQQPLPAGYMYNNPTMFQGS